MTPSSFLVPPSRQRRLLHGLCWVAAGALALGFALELWQSSMNERFAARTVQWLQGGEDAAEEVQLPGDESERALLRKIRQDPRAKQVVQLRSWSRGGWLTLCVADAKAYIVGFAVHVQGGRIVDLASTDPAVCRNFSARTGTSSNAT